MSNNSSKGAKQYVPEMHTELINQGYEPKLARREIEKDCAPMWGVATIVGALQ